MQQLFLVRYQNHLLILSGLKGKPVIIRCILKSITMIQYHVLLQILVQLPLNGQFPCSRVQLSRELNFMTASPVSQAAVEEAISLQDLQRDLGVEEETVVPIKVQKTRNAKCRVLQKVNRAESITGGLSTKKGDFPCSSVRASKRGRISKQGPVGKSSRPAARLQPANEETLVTPSRTSGLCRSRHSSQRSETRVPHGPAAQEQQTSSSTSFLPQCRINPDSQPVHSGLAGKGYHHNPEHPHPGVLEQIVPCTKGRWEKETCPKPISAKFVHRLQV